MRWFSQSQTKPVVTQIGPASDLPRALRQPGVLRGGDVLLIMGAGDIGAVAGQLVSASGGADRIASQDNPL